LGREIEATTRRTRKTEISKIKNERLADPLSKPSAREEYQKKLAEEEEKERQRVAKL
jgi:hypothetical protein